MPTHKRETEQCEIARSVLVQMNATDKKMSVDTNSSVFRFGEIISCNENVNVKGTNGWVNTSDASDHFY